MKNFIEFINESSGISIRLKQFSHSMITLGMDTNYDFQIIRSMIIEDAIKELNVKESKNILFVNKARNKDINMSDQFMLLFPDFFGKKVKKHEINFAQFHVNIFVHDGGSYIFQLQANNRIKTNATSMMLANPEWFIENAKPTQLLSLLNEPFNRKAIDSCLGREWSEKWLADRKGAAKLDKYDI